MDVRLADVAGNMPGGSSGSGSDFVWVDLEADL